MRIVYQRAAEETRMRFWPPCRIKRRDRRSDPITASQRDVVEIQGACRRHPVVCREDKLGCDTANGSRRRNNDELVEAVDHRVASEEQHGTTLIWRRERVPANLTPSH